MTFTEAIKAFIEFQETEGNRRKTIVRYRGILERFAEFMGTLEVRKLEKVTLPAFDKFRAFRKPKLSPKTMHHEGRIIKQFFAWCAKRGYISENPLATCKFSPPKASTKNVLSLEQVNAILLAATSYRHPVLSVLAFTGMRSGECRNLRAEDVDLKQDWIYIRSRPGFETKTNEERKVPIHPRLKFILSRLKPKKSGWYFSAVPSPKHPQGGNFISTKHLNEDFLVLLKRLEIPAGREESGFTIHSLRHFFKTFCITHGVGKPIVDTWQGHSLGKDPSNDYFHLSDEDSQRLMKGVPFGKEPGQKD